MLKATTEQLRAKTPNVEETEVKVLVVDDDECLLNVIKLCLELHGPFKIETARSVDEARKKIDSSPYEVIVSDYEMPQKNGLQFLEQLRADSINTPVIIFTERTREDIAVKALNLGAYRYIDKHGDSEAVYMELATSIKQAAKCTKSEQLLRASEERLRQVADNSQIWIWETDANGIYTYVSPAVERILGYKPEEITGKKYYFDFYVPEDKIKFKRITAEMSAEKKPFQNFTRRNMHKNGKVVWVSSSGLPILDAQGALQGYRGTNVDITERIEAEEKLKTSEEKYRHMFENVQDAIYIHSLTGTITSINNIVEEYGFKKDQVIGKNILRFVPKKYWPKLTLEMAKLSRGRRIEGEVEVNTPIGVRFAEYRSNPIISGNKVTGVLSVLRDITDRRKTEDALLESQQKFQSLFTANPEASVFLDTDFCVIEGNAQFAKMFGYELEEIKGKPITDLIVPKEAESESESIRRKMIQNHVEAITKRRRKDGTLVPLFMSGSPIFVNEKVIGIVIVYKDISTVINTQDELSKALSRAELLNEKLSVVGGFTRHDVRNKLMGISGNVYLAEKYAGDNDRLRASLDRIKVTTGNVLSILTFAKDFEMIGNQELTDIDVGAAVEEAVSLFSDLKGVQIINECHSFKVRADAMLTTVFHNLIENSLKYGETLTQIRIFTEAEHGATKIIYQDDGVGIDPEIKKRLFGKGVGKGTGYGLYLIKRTCEIYGWSIKETGQIGKGVCFELNVTSKA